jgi:hypothetical protein
MGAPNVHGWFGLWIIVKRGDANDDVRLMRTLSDQMAATPRAKVPDLSRR